MNSNSHSTLNILIAGGGSGGHLAPAIGIAEEFKHRGHHVVLGHSGREIDYQMLKDTSFEHVVIPAKPLQLSPRGFLIFSRGFRDGAKTTKFLIEEYSIDGIVATGGFVAAPALYAAKQKKIPSLLLNLDSPPGKANKLARRWATNCVSSVVCGWSEAEMVHPPLRNASANRIPKTDATLELGLSPELKTLLVTGASQGASTINALVTRLASESPSCFEGWQILHLTGSQHESEMREVWANIPVQSVVLDFLQSMALAWSVADFAVTRGGANTIAEIAFHSVPSLVMPYPYHKDDHQRTNAEPLERIGGVSIETDHKNIEANLECAGKKLVQYLQRDKERTAMRAALTQLNTVNGSLECALLMEKTVENSLNGNKGA